MAYVGLKQMPVSTSTGHVLIVRAIILLFRILSSIIHHSVHCWLQQKYTQSGGVRPFGLSTLIIVFDPHTCTQSILLDGSTWDIFGMESKCYWEELKLYTGVPVPGKEIQGNIWLRDCEVGHSCFARVAEKRVFRRYNQLKEVELIGYNETEN